MNDKNRAASLLDLLDKHHKDADLEDMIAKSRFLYECKTKGFNRLKKNGLIELNAKPKARKGIKYTDSEKKEMASKARDYREQGLSYPKIQEKLGGVSDISIKKWIRAYL
tara:strand:+ start:722 stop:1051 length:330 start_codon:yes stop_codon:yes gene_type:complete